MVVMCWAMSPCLAAGVYFFGWRVLAVVAVSLVSALVTEWVFVRPRGKPVTSAALVTGGLLGLSLPASIPLWMVALGSVVAVAFGKMMFGGFGRNAFNPALVGRAFLYVCFPIQLTSRFSLPPGGPVQALGAWRTPVDALTMATPMFHWKDGERAYELARLYLGNIGGSIGETSAIAIGIGCAVLLLTKTANWRLILSTVLGALAASVIGCYVLGSQRLPTPLFALGTGGLLFVAVYMATDPVSAAKTRFGQWSSGLAIGALTVLFRGYSVFVCGATFAVLLANTFSPLLDMLAKAAAAAKKAKAAAQEAVP